MSEWRAGTTERTITFEVSLKPAAAFYETEAKAGDGFRETQDCVRAVKKFLPP